MTTTARAIAPAPAEAWPEQGRWTYEDWLRLPDDGWRYEVLDGELHMTPPPSIEHQYRSIQLLNRMVNHANAHDLGIVLSAPIGVRLPSQPVPIEPDIVFVSAARRAIVDQQYIEGAPDLVVEILSPSNWPYDRNTKFKLYEAAGIPEYWIVDYRQRTVEVFILQDGAYTLEAGILREGDAARSRALVGFEVAVSDVFRPY